MNAVFPGLVVGRRNDAAARRVPHSADHDGLPNQGRMPLFFDGGEKGIHIDMENPPFRERF